MTVQAIPAGSRCCIDANILIYAEAGYSEQAKEVLARCTQATIVGILPFAALLEVCHRLMLIEARATGKLTGSNPARKLASRPELVRRLHVYRTKLDALKDMGLRIAPHSRADFDRALDLQSDHGLLTTDSVILATALRLGADHLVTTDRAFRSVPDIDVLVVDDVDIPEDTPYQVRTR